MANLITFDKPADWKRIKPDHYADFSIVNNEYTPCEYGYAIANEQKSYDVVSIFSYGPVGAEFLKELKAQLDSFSEDNSAVSDINDYIKENADGYAVTKTDFIRPLFYKKGKLLDKQCFINIMQIKTNVTTSYSLQIFVEIGENLYCLTTSAKECDEKKPLESLIKGNKYIDDMINVVFKTMREKA